MKKVIFLLLFPLIAEVVVSCCGCVGTLTFRYSNQSITVRQLDNSGTQPAESQADTVRKTAYGVRVFLKRERLACLQKRPSLFISSAYALSCGCEPASSYLAKDSIQAIHIITTNAFDNTHPAGSDISPYFKVFHNYTLSLLSDYVKDWRPTLFEEADLQPSQDILLMTPPTLGPEHSFKVQYHLSDGRILESTTPSVKLL
ncbi:DUF5034 domain-containing protein [Paraflavitalea pollutisoli]|uniref:DUF5034 domain-containing protein n=1 Tax=Paraflavitalea pollutisoli TaxID=3034143 RepID=UPI0023EAFF7D|nr:DUF5034 domain-containing protein [Paraflavitalea sp. H1-2-19X]